MRKFTKQIMSKHDGYVDALEDAIKRWRSAKEEDEKKKALFAVGEIGREIHRMNHVLGL